MLSTYIFTLLMESSCFPEKQHKNWIVLFLFCFGFNKLQFLELFQILSKVELKVQKVFIYPHAHTHNLPYHGHPACPAWTYHRGTFVKNDEYTLTHHYQNPQFRLGFTLGVVHPMGFDKCITRYHYGNIHSSFIA